MCGIAGFIDFKQQSTAAELKTMTDTLAHRGPDGSGYSFFQSQTASIGLGHRRLSIIDLSELGAQPMTWSDYEIVFNGEIYNFEEIKSELKTLGHQFVGQSDTEVLLHSYQQWKEQCIEKCIGMFSFVIHDKKEGKIFIARDRLGVKPLFYYWSNDTFLFASELKAFHSHPLFKKEMNPNAIASFLQYGNIPTGSCIFKNTHKLDPGHHLTLDLHTKNITIKNYWSAYDWYNKPINTITFDQAKKITKEKITKACAYRMVSDVPVGIFLSGGYDSTIVTAILQENAPNQLKTFTIGVDDPKLNEAPFAEEIAKHLGTDHHSFTCTIKDALAVIPKLAEMYDEPFADSSAIPTYLVSKMAKEHVTVALSADGGDELFAGYNRYDYLSTYNKTIGKLPTIIRKTAAKAMSILPANRIPVLKNTYNFPHRYEKLKGILKDSSTKNLMLSLSRQYFNNELSEVLIIPFEIEDKNYHKNLNKGKSNTPLRQMLAVDIETYLPDDILQKVDRATMANSLEGREPLLDHELFEWAAQLPDHFKYNKGIKKHILRELVYDYIPKEMMERPKMGFAVPIGDWMKNELTEDISKQFSPSFIEEQALFNAQKIQQMWKSYLHGKQELELKIWYLYMFQLWYRRWMMN